MTTRLRVVCDENIVFTDALRQLTPHIQRVPGRQIGRAMLHHADVLLVRSVTRVDETLLHGTPVKFVGTATAGTEHVDIDALQRLGIGFAAAPGSNAHAVADWVLTALAVMGQIPALVAGGSIGVVGLGHVGQRLAASLGAVGARVLGYDPLLARWPEHVVKASLEEVLAQPVVSLHAALHDEPPFCSRDLIDVNALSDHVPACFLNAGRGGLVTRQALLSLHRRGTVLALDTWPDEPAIDRELLSATRLATPHIAGYSDAAKRRGTDQLVSALRQQFPIEPPPSAGAVPVAAAISLQSSSTEPGVAVSDWLRQHYDIQRDDQHLRATASAGGIAGEDFDRMRRHYRLRAELADCGVRLNRAQNHLVPYAEALGLRPILLGE